MPPFSEIVLDTGDIMSKINHLEHTASPEKVKKDLLIDAMFGEIEVKPVNH